MLLLFQLLTIPVYGQESSSQFPVLGDSLKNQNSFPELSSIQAYVSTLTLPSIQLPFDLKGKKPSELLTNEDSTLNWKRFIPKLNGQIGLSYEAGQLANYFLPENEQPLQVLRTEANLKTTIASLPVQVAWRLATVKNPIGINNYFRVSFDTERFKNGPQLNQNQVTAKVNEQLSDLESQKSALNGKLGYVELLRDQLKLKIERELAAQQERLVAQLKEKAKAELVQADSLLLDSLSKDASINQDSLQLIVAERKAQAQQAQQKADSLQQEFLVRKAQIENLKSQADTVQYYIQLLSDFRNDLDSVQSTIASQKDKWMEVSKAIATKNASNLGLFKKLDIGLTYPKTSALSKNSIPVKGIDLEIQKDNWYSALTAGVTMNNLMVTNNALQNDLQNTANLFNQFDFQQITNQRLLFLAKSGYGKKESTHAFIGVRFTNKGVETGFYQADSLTEKTPAAGIELDLKWTPKFLKATAFDLVYGKTSTALQSSDTARNTAIRSLFSNERTHTGLFRVSKQFSKLRSSIIANVRFLDAMADMASMGVLQPNNLRFEIQSRHSITSTTQIGLTYRTDQNNVDRMADTTKKVDMYGINVSSILVEKIQISGLFNYLNQGYLSPIHQAQTFNYMSSVSISGNYKLFQLQHISSFQADFYKISTASTVTNLRHLSMEQMTRFQAGKNLLTFAYFDTQFSNDSVGNTTYLVQENFQIKRKKWDFNLGIKLATSTKYGNQLGGSIGFQYQWTEQFSLKMKVEKLILGDFYNTYDPERFSRFPFYCFTSLTYQLK